MWSRLVTYSLLGLIELAKSNVRTKSQALHLTSCSWNALSWI